MDPGAYPGSKPSAVNWLASHAAAASPVFVGSAVVTVCADACGALVIRAAAPRPPPTAKSALAVVMPNPRRNPPREWRGRDPKVEWFLISCPLPLRERTTAPAPFSSTGLNWESKPSGTPACKIGRRERLDVAYGCGPAPDFDRTSPERFLERVDPNMRPSSKSRSFGHPLAWMNSSSASLKTLG